MDVFLNGDWVPEHEARIPIDDRGFLFGDGVFESVRLHEGGFFRLDAHCRRLCAGAAALGLPDPDAALLHDIADRLREQHALAEGTLRITFTRGSEAAASPTLLVTLKPMSADWLERAERGWRLITAEIRHPPAEALPPHVKSLGRLHGLLAKLEASRAGVDDALLLSTTGAITEGPTWNVFWRVGRRLRTPALSVGVLDGVTRASFLELAPVLGYEIEEGRWDRRELDQADEIFATMSSVGCVSITELDGRTLDPARCEAAPALRKRYWQLVSDEVRGRQRE
jgi:branched-chain amino acid aminotransferase